jgi:hypothetical protein
MVSLTNQHRGYIHFLRQSAVLADADQVIDVVAVTPAQQSGTIEAAVTPKHDAGIRPVLADEAHQQGQNGPAVVAVASVTGAQVAHQQVTAAKHVQWEVTMVIVVGVKEFAGLVAMHWEVSAIEVQHDLLRWFVVLLDEVVPEQFVSLTAGPLAAPSGTGWICPPRSPPRQWRFEEPDQRAAPRDRSGLRTRLPRQRPVAGSWSEACGEPVPDYGHRPER